MGVKRIRTKLTQKGIYSMNKQKNNGFTIGKLLYYVVVIILIFIVFKLLSIYSQNNFGDFVKSEYRSGISQFTRDTNNQYSETASYCITNGTYNDAMFYKPISVKPNTPYKVTCMVKTEGVEIAEGKTSGGAHISINGTTERSSCVRGSSSGWVKLEFIFHSKNRQEVELGFRLGGYNESAKGKAYFSDFTLEAGIPDNSTTWNFACFIFDKIDVTIDNNGVEEQISLQIQPQDISNITENMARFKNSCEQLSGSQMSVNYHVIRIKDPITTISYDDENGYYIAPEDVEPLIKDYVQQNDYDHIFVAVRMGNMIEQKSIPVHDWIGLGAMDYYGIGFSNIRLPDDSNDYTYRYNPRINTFPEEVYVHEFLHSLERTLMEYEYEIPALHDNEKYGYATERLIGLKNWYQDYMRKNIASSNGMVGLDSIVYTLKPAHESDFATSTKIEEFKESKNPFQGIFTNIKYLVNKNK